jgi:hypothetical protein
MVQRCELGVQAGDRLLLVLVDTKERLVNEGMQTQSCSTILRVY